MAIVDSKLLAEKIEAHVQHLRSALEKEMTPEQTAACRGKIRGCRFVLDILNDMDKPEKDD